MTHIGPSRGGRLVVRGVTADNGVVRSVRVNGQKARALAPNFLEWEAVLEDLRSNSFTLTALADDEAGNIEQIPHKATISLALRRHSRHRRGWRCPEESQRLRNEFLMNGCKDRVQAHTVAPCEAQIFYQFLVVLDSEPHRACNDADRSRV